VVRNSQPAAYVAGKCRQHFLSMKCSTHPAPRSVLLRFLDPMLRGAAGVGSWQVRSQLMPCIRMHAWLAAAFSVPSCLRGTASR